jgi:hypothetical protein
MSDTECVLTRLVSGRQWVVAFAQGTNECRCCEVCWKVPLVEE